VPIASPSRPEATEYATSYANYISLATEDDVVTALASQLDEMLGLLRGLPEAIADTRHAPYTWSVKQVVGHLTDAERVFGHRAFRFARNDPTPLPAFDENVYVSQASFDDSLFSDLLKEFELVRQANVLHFQQLPAAAWTRSGVANGNRVSVRALAYILLGHTRHHLEILRKRLAGGKGSIAKKI